MSWAAVIWPTTESWPFARGEKIQIAGEGRSDRSAAIEDARVLDAVIRAPHGLPVAVYLVEVAKTGLLRRGPIEFKPRLANPSGAVWYVSPDGREIERGDRWPTPPRGWKLYHGTLPAPRAELAPNEATSGPHAIKLEKGRGRSVRCLAADDWIREVDHACDDQACWDGLAAVHAAAASCGHPVGSALPLYTPRARAQSLAVLSADHPVAAQWAAVCR